MREIKFRAWHAGAKKMYTVTYLDMEQGEVTEIAVKVHEAEGIVYSSVCPVKDLELMQYTGLKDKNGVEIYEGDIVNYLDNTSQGLMMKTVTIEDIRHLPDFVCSKWEEVTGNIHDLK